MTDPLGLLGNTGGVQPTRPSGPGPAGPNGNPNGPSFRETLEQQIAKVNELQHDASAAMEDLATGQRDDVESVILATQKADTAFRMLLSLRNKMMEAYDEVKQIRV